MNISATATRVYNSAKIFRFWKKILLALIFAFVVIFQYIPDVLTTNTYSDAVIIETNQNSSNWVIKFQVGEAGSDGLARVIEVRNVRQLSDFHVFPNWLQEKAAALAEYNKKHPDAPKTATLRTSGNSLGDAHRSANVTQIDPVLPSFLYNILGAALVVAYWALLLIVLPSLVWETMQIRRSLRQRMMTGIPAAILALTYFIDFFYI